MANHLTQQGRSAGRARQHVKPGYNQDYEHNLLVFRAQRRQANPDFSEFGDDPVFDSIPTLTALEDPYMTPADVNLEMAKRAEPILWDGTLRLKVKSHRGVRPAGIFGGGNGLPQTLDHFMKDAEATRLGPGEYQHVRDPGHQGDVLPPRTRTLMDLTTEDEERNVIHDDHPSAGLSRTPAPRRPLVSQHPSSLEAPKVTQSLPKPDANRLKSGEEQIARDANDHKRVVTAKKSTTVDFTPELEEEIIIKDEDDGDEDWAPVSTRPNRRRPLPSQPPRTLKRPRTNPSTPKSGSGVNKSLPDKRSKGLKYTDEMRYVHRILFEDNQVGLQDRTKIFGYMFADRILKAGYTDGYPSMLLSKMHGEKTREDRPTPQHWIDTMADARTQSEEVKRAGYETDYAKAKQALGI